LALPNEPTTWEVVDADTLVADQYWARIQTAVVAPEHTLALAGRLLDHNRAWSAIDLLAFHTHRKDAVLPVQLIERALRAGGSPATDEGLPSGSIDYDIGLLLDQLEAAGGSLETLVKLEWLYLVALQHTRPPRALFRALASDPHFFVEMVSAAFRPKNSTRGPEGDPSNADEAQVARARSAFVLLRAWRRPPGLLEDGSIDGLALRTWTLEARSMLAEADRAAIGDICIGEVLAGFPAGSDGVWPPEPVRDLLEELESPALSRGVVTGKFGARGVTTRGLYDGGAQERSLAEQYEAWSKQVMARWPETGRLLRNLAQSYQSWAIRHDAMSEETANSD